MSAIKYSEMSFLLNAGIMWVYLLNQHTLATQTVCFKAYAYALLRPTKTVIS